MKRFSILRIAAVLFLVVAGTLAPAAAKERPFHASGEGDVAGALYARCEATHLGRCSLYVDVTTYFLENGLFLSYGGRLTSASGDELYFVFDPEYYFFDPANGVVSATVTFAGGTGRFHDATGSADVMFDFEPYFYSFRFLIDGSIDY
jgi:hypothetical protein